MSSTIPPAYYSTPMPAHHHFNLRMILRSANERYHVIAESFRQNVHLSHHARRRAHARGLKIDTAQAARCPQKLVSVLPLHEIDTSVSPTLNRAASEDLLPVIPAPLAPAAQRPVIARITIPAASASRPVVEPVSRSETGPGKIFVPVAIRGQPNPWLGPTSRFSITPNNELFQVHKPVILDVPLDMTEVDDDASSGSSEASSSGPSTPHDFSSLVIRFKRKSLEIEGDSASTVEKRPKYGRKEWTQLDSGRNIEKTSYTLNVSKRSGISRVLA
ncbi:hypothetical protein J3R30DRAFT_3439050 [Lentinula aciculospora]|uniref:Uncharacterized protein n=1 Tax=Lentinula aciculospora TaxID=153920 RepID=A0A9W9DUZ9_9AGAR|nr:hypothetical protein J3R30DRAFT_3439050 [Lentinula aciculospora]